jgi:hypothetical protein
MRNPEQKKADAFVNCVHDLAFWWEYGYESSIKSAVDILDENKLNLDMVLMLCTQTIMKLKLNRDGTEPELRSLLLGAVIAQRELECGLVREFHDPRGWTERLMY